MKPEAGEVWEFKDGPSCYLLVEREPTSGAAFSWRCVVLIEDPEWPDEPCGTVTWLLEGSLENYGRRLS